MKPACTTLIVCFAEMDTEAAEDTDMNGEAPRGCC